MNLDRILEAHRRKVAESLLAELRRALVQHAFDGCECHSIIRRELRGLELEAASSSIQYAVRARFRDCVPIDVAIEVVGKLFDDGELA
jgi:hypothetical protein